MLLHLLSNVASLPVTKSVVKDSGMGKAVGSIEKHSKCNGTPNESAIKERVQRVKDEWQASVKARKAKNATESSKRPSDVPLSVSSPTLKRPKTEARPSSTAFSTLLKKVSKPATTKQDDAIKGDAVEKKSPPKVDSQNVSKATNGTEGAQSNGEPPDKKGT